MTVNKIARRSIQQFGILCCYLVCSGVFPAALASAQEFDGVVEDPQALIGKPIELQLLRGAPLTGTLTDLRPAKPGRQGIQFLEMELGGRSRNINVAQIADMQLDGGPMRFEPHYPTGQFYLVDLKKAEVAIEKRLAGLEKECKTAITQSEFEKLTESSVEFVTESVDQSLGVFTGNNVILVSDFPPQQRRQLVRTLDAFIPKLNTIFGFGDQAFVLPGKPIVAAFASRANLGLFQSSVVGNKSYGTIRAFFDVVDGHVIVTAEDDRSSKHMTWQAAWGLAGAYSSYSYSNVQLPAWLRVGLQQHCADVLVPGVTDHAQERRDVLAEIGSGSLNGILAAENLPGQRQIVCKLLVGHLIQRNAKAFSQMLSLIKLGHSNEDALRLALALSAEQLAASFGKSLGLPQLQP